MPEGQQQMDKQNYKANAKDKKRQWLSWTTLLKRIATVTFSQCELMQGHAQRSDSRQPEIFLGEIDDPAYGSWLLCKELGRLGSLC